MSQNWSLLQVSITTFGTLYVKLNDMLQSLQSNFSGTSFPIGAVAGQTCWRTDRKLKYLFTDDVLLGESGWVEMPIASGGIGLEIVNARGNKTTLDARLDMALNEDGTLKAPITVTPGQWIKPFQKYLNYDAQTGNFTVGRTLTGGTSAATAVISSDVDGGTFGTLFLSNVIGTFQNNEALTDGIGGAATADGTVAAAFEYVGTASFKVKAEDATDIYMATRRLKINLAASIVYAEVASSSYGSGDTTVVIKNASANLDNTLVDVEHSLFLPGTNAADGGKGALSPRMIGQHANSYAADTGAAGAYTCTLDPAPTAWFAGLRFSILIAHVNTGASTVAPNGLAAKNIKKNVSAALVAGDLPVGGIADFEYDGTNVQLLNPGIIAAATVTTNANLSGDVTSSGNVTTITALAKSKISSTGTFALADLPTIPLSKMGSVLSSGSTSLSTGTFYLSTIETISASTHSFYDLSLYSDIYIASGGTNSGISVVPVVTAAPALSTACAYGSIVKNNGACGNVGLNLVNYFGGTATIGYKVYKLTE